MDNNINKFWAATEYSIIDECILTGIDFHFAIKFYVGPSSPVSCNFFKSIQ